MDGRELSKVPSVSVIRFSHSREQFQIALDPTSPLDLNLSINLNIPVMFKYLLIILLAGSGAVLAIKQGASDSCETLPSTVHITKGKKNSPPKNGTRKKCSHLFLLPSNNPLWQLIYWRDYYRGIQRRRDSRANLRGRRGRRQMWRIVYLPSPAIRGSPFRIPQGTNPPTSFITLLFFITIMKGSCNS